MGFGRYCPVVTEFKDALERGDRATLDRLIRVGPRLASWVYHLDVYEDFGPAICRFAHSRRGSDMLAYLLEHGADDDVNVGSEWYGLGLSALHLAASHSLEKCELLLAHGADVNARSASGKTPLHLADQESTVALLLAHGADPKAVDEGGGDPSALCDVVRRARRSSAAVGAWGRCRSCGREWRDGVASCGQQWRSPESGPAPGERRGQVLSRQERPHASRRRPISRGQRARNSPSVERVAYRLWRPVRCVRRRAMRRRSWGSCWQVACRPPSVDAGFGQEDPCRGRAVPLPAHRPRASQFDPSITAGAAGPVAR